MSAVQVINPTIKIETVKTRVAAYVRVSTDEADQENSLMNQYDHYMKLINGKDEWVYVDMYVDNGITATQMKNRDEFNRLIDDAVEGKIDLILVKSISRFARNTYDSIKTVRLLKSVGVDVYFEKENIDTRRMKTEAEFATLSSLAQEESISISKNIRVALRHQMMAGTYHYGKMPYGYRKEGTSMVIVESEAKVIRYIFNLYLQGKSLKDIADELTKSEVPKKDGTTTWDRATIRYIITNTTYKGDVLLQKSYTEDFPFKRKKNNGEKDMFYVENYCPAIVDRQTFDEANERLKVCSNRPRHNIKKENDKVESIFANMMYCEECKGKLHEEYGREKWKCGAYKKRSEGGPVAPITELKIKSGFVTIYNKLVLNAENVLTPMVNHAQEYRSLQNRGNAKVDEINNKIAQITEQILIIGRLKAEGYMESAIYMQKSNELNTEIANLKKEKKYLIGNSECDNLIKKTTKIIGILKATGSMGKFDETVFKSIVAKVWIGKENGITFEMINGLRLKIEGVK